MATPNGLAQSTLTYLRTGSSGYPGARFLAFAPDDVQSIELATIVGKRAMDTDRAKPLDWTGQC